MTRILWATLLVSLTTVCTLAQEGELEVAGVGGAHVRYEKVDYTRELWIGLRPNGVAAADMLKAMRAVCDDTTAVAVIEVNAGEDWIGSAEEMEVLASVSAKEAISQLESTLDMQREYTRVVLVGVFETGPMAVRIAADKNEYADGVVLIDPPVGDLKDSRIPEERRVGVDILLHPRSDNEFEKQSDHLVDHLGHWGLSARILKAEKRFGTFQDSLQRVWDAVRAYTVVIDGEEADLSAGQLAKKLDEYDVVFVGELHGNPGAHRVELEFLRHFLSSRKKVALATEQWERDTQEHVDAFLADKMAEGEFVEKSRAWPNYADYRPLVLACRKANVPVIAGNIPRRLANRVFKEGTEVIETFSDDEKSWTAKELNADAGAYKRKFMGAMGGMGGHSDSLERMYAAQCIKDDTMAESVANWLKENKGGRVLHINGAFHSAEGLGAAEKLMALMPDLEIAMVTCVQEGEEFDAGPDEWVIRVPATRPRRISEEANPHD